MDNTIIFIDEIDAAKGTILNRIVDDSFKNNVDLVKLFLNIYTTLETKEFPMEMLKPAVILVGKEIKVLSRREKLEDLTRLF